MSSGITMSRRAALAGALLLPSLSPLWLSPTLFAAGAAEQPFAALEKQTGARIGVTALDTGSGKRTAWRADQRFVMCSTFKLSLAAAILARADKSREKLDRAVQIGVDAPLGVSPVTRKNVGHSMTIAQLCEAAVVFSDNGAANLLLDGLGGPQGLTRFWRNIGDPVTRLDDKELKLNIPDGDRNTTTPAAMLGNLNTLLVGDALSPASRARLLDWMHASTTGIHRLRAGLPAAWQWADKTGTSAEQYGLINDIGIATPPGRKPILIVCYTERSSEKVQAEVGKIVAEAFA